MFEAFGQELHVFIPLQLQPKIDNNIISDNNNRNSSYENF